MALKRILQKHGGKLLTLALTLGLVAYMYGSPPKYQGYAPDQPIPFSHKIHAGELQIDCQFCHTGVERSPVAGIPDTATCMKCHETVAPDSGDIQYLKKTYAEGRPLRWNKVHDLPDHARFSHKVHIGRGFDCSTCHGAVETMEKVEVAAEFNMGWCLNCHRENAAPTEQARTANTVVDITNCSTCHY